MATRIQDTSNLVKLFDEDENKTLTENQIKAITTEEETIRFLKSEKEALDSRIKKARSSIKSHLGSFFVKVDYLVLRQMEVMETYSTLLELRIEEREDLKERIKNNPELVEKVVDCDPGFCQ